MIGNERRVFQVLLHMVGHLLNVSDGGWSVIFRVVSEGGNEGRNDKIWGTWRPSVNEEYVSIKFEIELGDQGSQSNDGSMTTIHFGGRRHNSNNVKEGLSFSICRKLVQVRITGILPMFMFIFF